MNVTIGQREFYSATTRCTGDLYRPDVNRPPVIVMAHGFAGERLFGLPAYAERFAQSGMAVFLFDYRGFGASDGEPRHVVSFRHQREDWRAAVEFVRTIDEVDATRLGLWGTSYSGGHVIVTAATMPEISAVVAQVPAVDVPRSVRLFGPGYVLKATLHSVWDMIRSLLGLSPHYVDVVAPPRQFAVLNRPGCEAGFRRLIPEGSRWENRIAARELLYSLFNRPVRWASRVSCPALLVSAAGEQLVAKSSIRKAARLMPHATLIESHGDHFALYFDDEFERIAAIETEFFRRHLLNGSQPAT